MAVFTVICDEIFFCPNISSSNTNENSGTLGAPELEEKIFEIVTRAKWKKEIFRSFIRVVLGNENIYNHRLTSTICSLHYSIWQSYLPT